MYKWFRMTGFSLSLTSSWSWSWSSCHDIGGGKGRKGWGEWHYAACWLLEFCLLKSSGDDGGGCDDDEAMRLGLGNEGHEVEDRLIPAKKEQYRPPHDLDCFGMEGR